MDKGKRDYSDHEWVREALGIVLKENPQVKVGEGLERAREIYDALMPSNGKIRELQENKTGIIYEIRKNGRA